MSEPFIALLIGVTLIILTVVLFWPEYGLAGRLLRAFRADERVLIEDALKHIYDCEYKESPATWASLAGALKISEKKAIALVSRLVHLGLVRADKVAYRLTAEGRSYALRVIRIHRLWESYLSEKTGFEASVWHAVADKKEHRTTPEEAKALAAKIHFPRFDPHGDPIPTADGHILPVRGTPIAQLPLGMPARIVHVEDEPEAIYQQLIALGLHTVGRQVTVFEANEKSIRLEADGTEHILAPVFAANLWAVPIAEGAKPAEDMVPLSELKIGETAEVTGISSACRGLQRRRLFDLGFVPGTAITAEMLSPSGDAAAYRIRGALIALRNDQSAQIHIRRGMRAAA